MFDEPSGADIKSLAILLDRANDLKRLPRMGWLLAGVAPAESVAEHSYGVAFLSLLLVDVINGVWAVEGLIGPLSVERTLRLALLHDLAESLLTDLPKRSSELIGSTVKHAAEETAMATLLATLPDGDDYLALWQEYDAASTAEARLVKDADKLEMVHQALCYETRGQANLDEFWQGHQWHYRASQMLFETLSAERK
jgi:putative hydrolase of HD superfamily